MIKGIFFQNTNFNKYIDQNIIILLIKLVNKFSEKISKYNKKIVEKNQNNLLLKLILVL